MILLGILRQQHQRVWRLCSPSVLQSTTAPCSTAITRYFSSDRPLQPRPLLSANLPVLFAQPQRFRKLKFSFGYTNYGHRRHVRPPGHHVVHYLQFFMIIIGAYAIFYLTNVTEFEDRWSQPVNLNQITEMNSYVHPQQTQRQMDLFSHVKAASLPSAETNPSDSESEEQKEENLSETAEQLTKEKQHKKDKPKVSFRDKKKIAYENRIRAYSTPDKIFRYFATVKVYTDDAPDGTICMTPADFLRSITPGLKQPDGLELDKFRRYDPRVDTWEKLEHLNTHLFHVAGSDSDQPSASIFERIGGKQCLLTFSDYIFLVTLLSTPARYFNIAFQMFDYDGSGSFDFDEFTKLKTLIRDQTSVGQRHRDHAATGNILRETSILNEYFFGENLDQFLSAEKFMQFYEQLQNEILELEFNRAAMKSPLDPTHITELDFANALLAYSGLSENRTKKMLKRIKKFYPINDPKSTGISFESYKKFYSFLRNIHDVDVALTFFHIAGGAIDKTIFRHVARVVSHVDIDEHLTDLVFVLFDENGDQRLSYVEFVHLMKNRLERGLQKPKDTAFMKIFSTMIACAKETVF